MKANLHDYVVYKHQKRRYLAQITEVLERGAYTAVNDHERWKDPDAVTFHADDVVAVLGPKPASGSAYGVKIEPYWKTVDGGGWGQVKLFGRFNKETWLAVKKGLQAAYSTLEKEKLLGFIEAGSLSVEVRPSSGKNLGMYYFKQKGEHASDRLLFRIQETQHADLYREVILHEAGHGVFYRLLSARQRAAWTRMHTKFASFAEHTAADIARMQRKFVKAATTVRAFQQELEDEDSMLFDACLAQICSNFRVKVAELDELIKEDQVETLSSMWPREALEYTDFETAVNEYASTNPRELYAETFRLIHTKTKLPKAIEALMRSQLSSARG